MSWYGERSCSRPAFLRSFGSWYQQDRTALSSIWCLWFHHRLQRLGQTPRVKPCTVQSPSRIKVDFGGWSLPLEKKLGNACRYFKKDVRITTAMLLHWEEKLKPPTLRIQNVQEPDRGRSFWDSGNCRWDLGGWACWCHSIGSFNLIWFDANGEYFRGFDNPACVPPIFTNDQFPTLVIKIDWCDCHRKHHSLVSWVLELRYSKWTPLWLGALFEGLHWTQTTRNNTRALSQAHDVPAKIIASISADLSTKNRICIFWYRV